MLNVRVTLLFLILVVSLDSAQCPIPEDQRSQVMSNSFTIKSEDSDNLDQFNITFDSSFNKMPSVGFGINEFSSEKSPHIEIKIVNTMISKQALVFEVQGTGENEWKSLKINFLSTTRNDIELGTADFQSPQSQGSTGEMFQVSYPIQKDFQTTGLKIKPFIQGFDLESNDMQSVGVKLDDTDVKDQKVFFSFANPNRASIVRSLTLCVIVFNVYTPGVLYADGIFDQNYVQSKTQIMIPTHGINELRTYIVGINSFQTSVAQKISVSSAIDETFRLTIGPINRNKIDYVSVSYLILSIIDCGSCEGNPILYQGICQPICPFGFKQQMGTCVKIICSEGFEVGPQNKCVPECGDNEVYMDGRCQCMKGFNHVGGKCIECPQGTFYNNITMTCDSLCGPNAQFLDGMCYCNPGYYVINNMCQACPKGTKYESEGQKCVSICMQNQVFNGQSCVCGEGFNIINNKCAKCFAGTTYNSVFGVCQCQSGKRFDNAMKKCLPICTDFEMLQGQKCQCKDEFVRIQGVCGSCPMHSFYFPEEQKCYCKFGFRRVGKTCQCPKGQIFNTQMKMCVDRCPQRNEVFIRGKCDCRDGEERDMKGFCYPPCGPFQERLNGKCVCIDGYFKGVNGPCVPIVCPTGFQWDPMKRQCRTVCPGFNQIQINGQCVCVPGFERQLIYGICQPACPSNQVRMNGKCVCSPGNKIINGACTNCPRYSQYVHGVCVCYNGNPPIDGECQKLSCPDPNHVYDSISKSCKCKGPLVWIRGRCEYLKGCGTNEYWCGTHCACHYGYVRKSGQCVKSTAVIPKCPPFSRFDVISYRCVCNPGYHLMGEYTCRKCSAGAYWNGHKCSNDGMMKCAQGFISDGVSCVKDTFSMCNTGQYMTSMGQCRCKTGFFMIGGKCKKCHYGTYFDGIGCTDIFTTQCTDPYKFWNGAACVCMPNYFEYGKTCVRCPANTVWNGLCCKVPSNLVAPLVVVNGY